MIKNFFFDLDGTINDSSEGIIKAVKYALKKFDIEVNDQKLLKRYIGPPLMDCFMEINHLNSEQSQMALQYYREYYNVTGKYENRVYDGIVDLLESLYGLGVNLYVATSKPEDVMNDIVNHFDLRKYFKGVYGASLDSKRNKKTAVIKYALKCGNIDSKTSIMIGDHKHDILGAKDNGLKSIAVTYGYGDIVDIINAKPDYKVDSVKELKQLLTSLIKGE